MKNFITDLTVTVNMGETHDAVEYAKQEADALLVVHEGTVKRAIAIAATFEQEAKGKGFVNVGLIRINIEAYSEQQAAKITKQIAKRLKERGEHIEAAALDDEGVTTAPDNCLEGIQCPICASSNSFRIVGKASFEVTDYGTGDCENVEWQDTDYCKCNWCGHNASLYDFRNQHPASVGRVASGRFTKSDLIHRTFNNAVEEFEIGDVEKGLILFKSALADLEKHLVGVEGLRAEIANMTQDGEEVDGEEFVMENDDAVTTLNTLIDHARTLKGVL